MRLYHQLIMYLLKSMKHQLFMLKYQVQNPRAWQLYCLSIRVRVQSRTFRMYYSFIVIHSFTDDFDARKMMEQSPLSCILLRVRVKNSYLNHKKLKKAYTMTHTQT